MIRTHVLICGGTGCTSSNSLKIQEAMNTELAARGLENEVKVVLTGCFGLCALGPVMIVYPRILMTGSPRFSKNLRKKLFVFLT